MIYEAEPEGFSPKHEVVSCIIEVDDEFLLLHRQGDKTQGNKWGLPAGKIDPGESPLIAVRREVFEETGIEIAEDSFSLVKKLYVRYPDHDFIYYMYQVRLKEKQNIVLSEREHQGSGWFTIGEAIELPLVDGLEPCLRYVFDF